MAKENNGKVTGYFQNCEMQNSTKTISYLCGDSVEVIEKKGRNVIPEAEKEPLWKAYLEKFKDPIIIILLVALGLSLGVSGYEMAYSGRDASCLIEPLGVLVAIILATQAI